jgi:hypothetical protein
MMLASAVVATRLESAVFVAGGDGRGAGADGD